MSDVGLVSGVRYPTDEDGWIRTVGIGAALEVLSFLIVPAFVLLGYYVRVMRETATGEDTPPEFSRWGELLVDGFYAALILVAYLSIPLVTFWVLVGSSLVAGVTGTVPLRTAIVGAVSGLVVTLFVSLLFLYVGAAGIARFARTGSVASAFTPRLLATLASPSYLKAWAFVLVLSLGGSLLVAAIAAIPFVNLLLVVLVPVKVKYLGTVYARLWARGAG